MNLLKSASLVSLLTFASRVTGLVREQLVAATFGAMVFWLLGELRTSLYFVAAVLGLMAIAALLTEVTLRVLQRRRLRSLAMRQALRGLFRPRNPTRAIGAPRG